VDEVAPATDANEARKAVERETGKLSASYQQWPKVRQVSASLTESREDNHFADKLAELFRS
jgi:hypothetical protein